MAMKAPSVPPTLRQYRLCVFALLQEVREGQRRGEEEGGEEGEKRDVVSGGDYAL